MAVKLEQELLRYLRSLRAIPKAKQGELSQACLELSNREIPDTLENRKKIALALGLLRLRIPEIQNEKNRKSALVFFERTDLIASLEADSRLSMGKKK